MISRTETIDGVTVIHLAGRIDARAAGPLGDLLVATVRSGDRRLAVAFSERTDLTRAGLRGLVVAATLMRSARGRMRLCGPARLGAFLHAESFVHLLPFDDDLRAALVALGMRPPPAGVEATDPEADPRPAALSA
jgi:anti-anti-sigma regulatory factor